MLGFERFVVNKDIDIGVYLRLVDMKHGLPGMGISWSAIHDVHQYRGSEISPSYCQSMQYYRTVRRETGLVV